jgi:hypothetical protein
MPHREPGLRVSNLYFPPLLASTQDPHVMFCPLVPVVLSFAPLGHLHVPSYDTHTSSYSVFGICSGL